MEGLKINGKEIKLYPNLDKGSPFMLLEDKNSILYFDKGIFYINIKTGQYKYYKLKYLNKDDIKPKFCILENNKFIIYFYNIIKIYKYKKNKLNEIFCKIFDDQIHIHTIFKLFNDKYILIKFKNNKFQILYESKLNFYVKIFEFKSNIYNLTPIDNFKNPDETYFY